jgi:hypothetical protein
LIPVRTPLLVEELESFVLGLNGIVIRRMPLGIVGPFVSEQGMESDVLVSLEKEKGQVITACTQVPDTLTRLGGS